MQIMREINFKKKKKKRSLKLWLLDACQKEEEEGKMKPDTYNNYLWNP